MHPRDVYVELCRIVGQLSIFRQERRAADFLPYDHDNLYEIFMDIRVRIESLIHAVRDYEVQQRYFVGVGHGMQVAWSRAGFIPIGSGSSVWTKVS